MDTTIMVGGEAGQGVQSVGFWMARVFARGGYYVFADQDYESRIRGGHSFFRVRARDTEVCAIREPLDMLLALNKETIDLHRGELLPSGVIIYDGEHIKDAGEDGKLLSVPLVKLALEKAGNRIMSNTVLLGAALGLLEYDFEIISSVLLDHFGRVPVGENNVKAARAGYDYAQEHFKDAFTGRMKGLSRNKRMLVDGNQAVSLGALAAGCKFIAAYPMTPTTPILEYLAAKADEFGLVAVQPEDEIAAACMAVGANYAGVRAMTATSGSGFCLMVEALGMAGITETPVVFIEGQRPGPAVGLPTRTEQGDLQFVISAHHGEFPRVVLAPANFEDAFWLTVKAFNLAEKYQIPVIVQTDHYLATSYGTVEKFDLSGVTIERGELYPNGEAPDGEYRRHKVTRTGISPRAFPGTRDTLVVTDTDEHDDVGHLTEDAGHRSAQVLKRLRKMYGVKEEIIPPRLHGPKKAELMLVGWGSSYGALKEAVDMLRAEERHVNLLHINWPWPFPVGWVRDAMDRVKRTYVVEQNATGQLAYLLHAETGREIGGKVLKFDGRPLTPAYIVGEVKRLEGY